MVEVLMDSAEVLLQTAEPITLIESVNAHYVIFGCSIFAILWGALNALWVSTIPC